MMKTVILTSLFFLCAAWSSAQEQKPLASFSFDNEAVDFKKVSHDLDTYEYAHAGFTATYSPGIRGKALDLTEDVAVRIPYKLTTGQTPDYTQSFSVGVWVKTKPNARQGTVIMSNKKSDDRSASGWTIGTNDLGAWYFHIGDGKTSFNYEPTPQRQAINDGKWHYIAFSMNMDAKELWLYFDGRNVAIYNVENLTDAKSKMLTVVGGSDEYTDWGSRGEWTAFNGLVDEVEVWNTPITAAHVASVYAALNPQPCAQVSAPEPDRLKVQVWNIWHGGRRFGKHVGVERVIDVLKKENADVIGLVETYGSGAIIADSLGYYFYLISSNLSIMSRYPIEHTIKVFDSFFSGGALLNVGNKKVAIFDIWLNYAPDECELFGGPKVLKEFMKKEATTRQKEIKTILKEISPYVDNTHKVPVIMVGDFNSGSHLDWTEREKELHFGLVIDWQTSRTMMDAGFTDSFREINPDPLKDPGFTWSPLINHMTKNQNCVRDRIDFIYYKGENLLPYRSRAVEDYPHFWPSDHGTMVTWFYLK